MKKTIYLGPGDLAYWRIRAEAFSLINTIGQDLSKMDDEEEAPYWKALLQARENSTVLEILRAQGREMLLTPTLGSIPVRPKKTDEELVAENFGLALPIDLFELAKKAYHEEDWELVCYLDHLKDGPSEFAPWIERIMTPEGIVRIETEQWSHEEGSFYRRETYLNGELHDYEGRPAVYERSHHRIPEESHLDTGFEEAFQHGVRTEAISRDDQVVAGWAESQRYTFGAADYDRYFPEGNGEPQQLH